MLSERQERIAQVEAEIDGLLARVLMLREMLQRHQRLLEAPDRFPVGRARGGLGTGLTKVREGLSPHLAPEGMVRQAFNLFIQAVGRQAVRWPRQSGRGGRADAPGAGCHRRPPASARA